MKYTNLLPKSYFRKGLSNVFLENDPNIREVESTIAPHESFAISEFSEPDESVVSHKTNLCIISIFAFL